MQLKPELKLRDCRPLGWTLVDFWVMEKVSQKPKEAGLSEDGQKSYLVTIKARVKERHEREEAFSPRSQVTCV